MLTFPFAQHTSNITEHVFFDCLKDMPILSDSTTETQNKLVSILLTSRGLRMVTKLPPFDHLEHHRGCSVSMLSISRCVSVDYVCLLWFNAVLQEKFACCWQSLQLDSHDQVRLCTV